MRKHQELFQNVRERTGMYFVEQTYASVSAFVLGFDAACEGGVLTGFREWLVMRVGTGSNLSWPALVLHAAFPDERNPQGAVKGAPAQRKAIDTLFDLIAEFDETRTKHDGLQEIFVAYQVWEREARAKGT